MYALACVHTVSIFHKYSTVVENILHNEIKQTLMAIRSFFHIYLFKHSFTATCDYKTVYQRLIALLAHIFLLHHAERGTSDLLKRTLWETFFARLHTIDLLFA